MGYSLFCDIVRRRSVVSCRHFGTTYWSCFQGWSGQNQQRPSSPWNDSTYQCTLRNVPEDNKYPLQCDRSLKSWM